MDPLSNRGRSPPTESDSTAAEGADPSAGELSFKEPAGTADRSPEVPEAPSSENPAVRSLVDGYQSSPPVALTPTSGTPPTDNNAFRTSQRDSTQAYADSGTTLNGDSWFAGAAALKTRDPRTGTDAEVFSGSVQVGRQNEIQAGLARVGYSGERGGLSFSVGVEALTARANAGIHNDDGSQGMNFGAMATGAGIEGTVGYSGWSVTGGLSVSAGASVSTGERNVDGDAVPERCFKLSVGPATLGFCSEL